MGKKEVMEDCRTLMGMKRSWNRPGFGALVVVTCLVSVTLLTFCEAHVGLTFPPARQYDLDFLDAIRTKPPCGMPKGSVKTSLVAGSTINVTWHLSYPHQGGYRLELMDSQERTLLDLTPTDDQNETYVKSDPTAQAHEIRIPTNFTCESCTIRLLRQASEWSNNYRFWSCADVDIVLAKQYKETCSGSGRAVVGRCVCNKGFWGSRCQYEDECETDNECGGNGKCIDLGGTALPRKQCFCSPGFHGERCLKRNTVKLPTAAQPLDLSRHTKRVLSDRMTLHYRVLPAAKEENKEIEFVLLIQGTSYGALGWRPKGMDKTCKRWPLIQNSTTGAEAAERQGKNAKLQIAASSDAAAVAESEPKSEPESAAAEPESAAEPGSKSKDKHHNHDHVGGDSKAEPEPESAAESEPASEPESSSSEPESTAEPEGTAEPETTSSKTTTSKHTSGAEKLKSKLRTQRPVDGTAEVHVETSQIAVTRTVKQRQKRSPVSEESSAEPEPETEPEPEGKSEPEPETSAAEPEPEGTAKAEPEGEPESEAEPDASDAHLASTNYKMNLPASVWTPKGEFHAMDCIDLVMGGARGPLSRIRDYYTRDRSTPRLDRFYGGKDDLTSATGWEEGDKTVLIFRRKLRSTDEADHSIDGQMHVIWARGQEPGEYNHSPPSGLERGAKPSRAEFYARDEIKYHGKGAQRGVTRIDFVAEASTGKKKTSSQDCENGWAHPPGCSNSDSSKPCTYNATWRYLPDIDSIKFTIETRKPDRWTGIGFSDEPTMRNSDAVLGWVSSGGQFFHMDTYMTSYTAPALDYSQDISNMTGKYRDGIVHWSFIRKVKTSDNSRDISLEDCRYFLFPIEGGVYNPVNKKIRKHEETPIASAEKVCIPRECRPIRVIKPAELRYEFDIKFTGGFGNNWKPPRKGSEDFMDLENRIGSQLSSGLKEVSGFNRLQLTDIKRDGEGARASLELMVSPNSTLAEEGRVKSALEDTIKTGRVGSFQIDPTFLELKSPVLLAPELDDEGSYAKSAFGPERLWIVLGCVAALILLALLQAGLTIVKVFGKPTSHKDSSGSGMAWRDYSETNYGYDAYDEKQLGPNTIPLTGAPPYYGPSSERNGHHSNGAYGNGGKGGSSGRTRGEMMMMDPGPPSMSLPRPQHSQGSMSMSNSQHSHHSLRHNGGGGGPSGASGLNHNPDFYFMPSQRKYSGEVVRVYVDHNKR